LLDEFTDINNASNLQLLAREIQTRIGQVSTGLTNAQDGLDLTIQQAVAEYTIPTLEVLNDGNDLAEERRLVSLLEHALFETKRQLEGYRSLGATGLAAEVVNHEFEQQYELIRNLFDRPHVRGLVNRTPDLERIEELLKQIEERHRLMSPLYRRTRMYRKDLALKDIGRKMAEFFHAQIDLYKIDFQNRIDDDFIVRESEPILYPVFINIINNAVYWLLNRTNRTILLWTDREKGALYLEDSGKGVAPDDAERVFELFYTTRVDGRGIGLHLVRELLSSRNHVVTCVTDPKEKKLAGACFRITFEPGFLTLGGESV
jgi:signal transduction histidine kinase